MERAGSCTSVNEVRKFVTRVWEHPLADQRTRNHRVIGRRKLVDFLTGIGMPPEKYVAAIVGSSIWTTDADSDHDFMVVIDGLGISPEHLMAIGEWHSRQYNVQLANVVSEPQIGITNTRHFLHWDEATLMFTPDEHLSGNLNLAHRLRLKIIKSIMQSQRINGGQFPSWQTEMEYLFRSLYKNWALDPTSAKHERRSGLFYKRLQERSMQSLNPGIWQDRFLNALYALSVPPLEVFHEALTQTQGELKLDPRYQSNGIREN